MVFPLFAILTSANTHDVTVAIDTVDCMILKDPKNNIIIDTYKDLFVRQM